MCKAELKKGRQPAGSGAGCAGKGLSGGTLEQAVDKGSEGAPWIVRGIRIEAVRGPEVRWCPVLEELWIATEWEDGGPVWRVGRQSPCNVVDCREGPTLPRVR